MGHGRSASPAKRVISTRVGYIGGETPDPTYDDHHGHAEAVEVVFDPAVLSYRSLLELFFQIHDPTTYEQQGSDVGPSYRSAIFYTDKRQMEVALETIAEIEASGRWPGPVLSEINPEEPFWEAEPEHQKYLLRYPRGYSCHFARPAWLRIKIGEDGATPRDARPSHCQQMRKQSIERADILRKELSAYGPSCYPDAGLRHSRTVGPGVRKRLAPGRNRG